MRTLITLPFAQLDCVVELRLLHPGLEFTHPALDKLCVLVIFKNSDVVLHKPINLIINY